MDIAHINWLAVFAASLAFFGLGVLWYGPLFGRAWQRAVALSSAELKDGGTAGLMVSAFIMTFIVAVGMAIFLHGPGGHTEFNASYGALIGLMIGIFFILPSTVMNAIFARRPLSLILIDGFYHITANTLIGFILGTWH